MNTKPPTILLTMLLLTFGLAGCVGDDEGRITVYVRDAATDEFSRVFITFSKVAIHRGDESGAGAEDGTAEPDTEGSGWETVFEGTKEIDLLDFAGEGARAFLGDAKVTAGTYDQIVITVDEARGVSSTDGSFIDITVTTGWVRVVRAFEITGDETTRIVLDIDLDHSLVKQGPLGGWRLNPVIGSVSIEEASGAEGSVTGDDAAANDNGDADASGTSDGAGGAGGSGSVHTYVKDAPTDEFSEIWIRFSDVTVHAAGSGTESDVDNGTTGNGTADNGTADNGTESDGSDGGWHVIVDTPRTLDLLRFSDEDSRAFLGDDALPAGRYTQIRVNVTESWGIRTSDGANVTIMVAQTEAKIVRSFEVDTASTTVVVIDLDLDRSLVRQGPQGWRMTPVIGSVQVEKDAGDAGTDVPDA